MHSASPTHVSRVHDLGFLLQKPHEWTAQHQDFLRVREESQLSPKNLLDPAFLPCDGDQEFEDIAADFTKPGRTALQAFSCWVDRANTKSHFLYPFNRLREMMTLEDESNQLGSEYFQLSKRVMISLIDVLLGLVHTTTRLSQMLAQALLAFQMNPTLDRHRGFVLRMEGTKLQLNSASIPRPYIHSLSQDDRPRDELVLLRSVAYDLREPEQRREALRILIGLLRHIDATQFNG